MDNDPGLRDRAVDGRSRAPAEHHRDKRHARAPTGRTRSRPPAGVIRARWLINAAGLGSDVVDRMMGDDDFTITPRRGQLVVFDKLARHAGVGDHPADPDRNDQGRARRADDLRQPAGRAHRRGPARTRPTRRRPPTGCARWSRRARRSCRRWPARRSPTAMPDCAPPPSTATTRSAATRRRYVCVGGIRSTGLSASLASPTTSPDCSSEAGLPIVERADVPPPPRMPNLGEAFERPATSPSTMAARC